MSYTIKHANGANPIVIADGTINNSTSITLVGKNTANYGQYLDQNFLYMLENFANSSQPSSAITGQLWYDTTHAVLQVYTGSQFKNINAATAQQSRPVNASLGDLWFDTVNRQLNVYDNVTWVTIGPFNAGGTVVGETLFDGASTAHNVISFKINTVVYAILYVPLPGQGSFTPTPAVPGFGTIIPGFNIASTSLIPNNRLVGTATNADQLGGVSSAAFMRADVNTSTVGTLQITNNNGLLIGTGGATGQVDIFGNQLRIENITNNGPIRFVTRTNNGTAAFAMDVLANADVQVYGNLIVSGNLDVVNSNENAIITGITPSYNTTNGALVVTGGVGIGGNINVGGTQNTLSGNVYVGNLIANGSANNGNVYANYVNAGTIGNSGAILYGTLNSFSATQTNITSLGTLTGLQVSGAAGFTGGSVTFNPTSSYKLSLGSVAHVQVSGGQASQYLQTDGNGNLSWQTIPTPVAGGGSAGQFAIYTSGTNLAANSSITFNGTTMAVTGAITATGDITAFLTSDKNLKTNITNISHALQKVNAINGVTYNWNEIAKGKDSTKTDDSEAGVIAQELAEVLPQVVTQRGDGYLAVRYEKIIPLLIEAIKELAAEVEALKARGS